MDEHASYHSTLPEEIREEAHNLGVYFKTAPYLRPDSEDAIDGRWITDDENKAALALFLVSRSIYDAPHDMEAAFKKLDELTPKPAKLEAFLRTYDPDLAAVRADAVAASRKWSERYPSTTPPAFLDKLAVEQAAIEYRYKNPITAKR